MTSKLILMTKKLIFLAQNKVFFIQNETLLTQKKVYLTQNETLLTLNKVLLTQKIIFLTQNDVLLTIKNTKRAARNGQPFKIVKSPTDLTGILFLCLIRFKWIIIEMIGSITCRFARATRRCRIQR